MPVPWPKYIIIKIGMFTDGKVIEAFQIAGRTGFDPDEGIYWYDTKMVPGKNDPVTLEKAKRRYQKLLEQDPVEKEKYGG